MEKLQRTRPAQKTDFHRLSALAVLILEASLVLLALTPAPRNPDIPNGPTSASYQLPTLLSDVTSLPSSGMADAKRAIYPYSVIAGGVINSTELTKAVAQDPVVAEHYASFNVGQARLVRLNENRAVYVSYRLGNRVFWTKKKLLLPKGEILITDGAHLVRTRCGNRVSEAPAAPVSKEEPFIEGPEIAQLAPSPIPVASLPPLPSLPPAIPVVPTVGTPPPGIVIPPILPPVVGGGPPPKTPGPPVITPEPDLLLMLATGLTSVWIIRKKLKS
jgi:hypothetical protein